MTLTGLYVANDTYSQPHLVGKNFDCCCPLINGRRGKRTNSKVISEPFADCFVTALNQIISLLNILMMYFPM